MSTIFALASAPGRAGVSVIRVSGPAAFGAVKTLCGRVPKDRVARLQTIRSFDDQVVDHALVLVFSGPASFTGEDVAEFHVHGGPSIVQSVLRLLGQIDGCHGAEPGEFTRRAMENGKLDLTEVEGLADLIDAETEVQRHQAMRLFEGALGKKVEKWRASLLRAASLVEATVDFSDEEIPSGILSEAQVIATELLREFETEIEGSFVAERVKSGFEVAIVGPPNVGKSTLLNFLAGREAAITSEVAGTTRDVIEVKMDLFGFAVTFLDTAGIRSTDDQVEKIGVSRALSRAGDADLRIFLCDPAMLYPLERLSGDIVLTPKADLLPEMDGAVSGLTGLGVDYLLDAVREVLENRCQGVGVAVQERHRSALQKAAVFLEAALELFENSGEVDLVAEELRSGLHCLEVLVGRIDVEDLLGEIFSSFCIGK